MEHKQDPENESISINLNKIFNMSYFHSLLQFCIIRESPLKKITTLLIILFYNRPSTAESNILLRKTGISNRYPCDCIIFFAIKTTIFKMNYFQPACVDADGLRGSSFFHTACVDADIFGASSSPVFHAGCVDAEIVVGSGNGLLENSTPF